jgi:hypothetical protein
MPDRIVTEVVARAFFFSGLMLYHPFVRWRTAMIKGATILTAWCGLTLGVLAGCSGAVTVPADGGPANGVQCGTNACVAGEFCCNESCGICAPAGGSCTMQQCLQPRAECKTDADCRTFSDYCTGCDCRALSNSAPPPVCEGPRVECFADPCMRKVAACENGACVLRVGSSN